MSINLAPPQRSKHFWFDFYLDYNKREWEFKSFTTCDDPVKQRVIKWPKYLKYIVFNKLKGVGGRRHDHLLQLKYL